MKLKFRLSIANRNSSDRPTKKMYNFQYLSLELKCPGFILFVSLQYMYMCIFLTTSPNGTQSSVINSYESKETLRNDGRDKGSLKIRFGKRLLESS